jgi:hypothetical protein
MQTPAKGSPLRRRTSRMSNTRAASGLVLEKRAVRAPVGSWRAIWLAWMAETGSLKCEAGEGGGGKVLILRFTEKLLAGWWRWEGRMEMRMSDDCGGLGHKKEEIENLP